MNTDRSAFSGNLWMVFVMLLLMSSLRLYAQPSTVRIQQDFNARPLHALISYVEQVHDMHCFYLPYWFDSLSVVQPETPALLSHILENSLKGSNLSFYLDELNQLYFTWNKPLRGELKTVETEIVPIPRASSSDPNDLYSNLLPARPGTQVDPAEIALEIGDPLSTPGDKITLSGYVKDEESGEPIIGASVFVSELEVGMNTDQYGFYSLTLPAGEHMVRFRSYSKEERRQKVRLYGDGSLDMAMYDAIRQLDVVLIEAERDANITSAQMGLAKMSVQTLKQMPAFLGEIDVIKSALLLPGVQSVGEGAAGFNVRGGGVGQNLILLNQAPIFNSSHLFGFFSVFNPDMIKQFDLYKSGIPARYGGRLSSVLDIALKDGNKTKLVGSGGVSPVAARFTVEGPIGKKQNHSFIVGGRSSYSDWILARLPDPLIQNSKAGFFDVNGKINLELSRKDRIDFSAYFSRDNFLLNRDTAYTYRNLNGSVNWKHLFNNRLYAVNSAIYSQYNYQVTTEGEPTTAFDIGYQIRYHELKTDFTYIPQPRHQIRFGANVIFYRLNPGNRLAPSPESIVQPLQIDTEQALESGLYISDEWDVNPRLKLYGGLRFSQYVLMGPYVEHQYADNVPRQPDNIADSLTYGNGSWIKGYGGPELRLSARFEIDEKSSVKFSFNRLRQYLHMLSNTTSISPTDTWKLSDPHIRPQIGDQLSLGYYRNLRQNSIETSIELYVKRIKDLLEFKNGAQLLLNPYIETDLINARGNAYGAEFLIRKERGKLNGWVSYTYSRVFVKADGRFPDETINNGQPFPANVDKPHDFSFVGNYKFSRRFSISSNLAYSTGRPITYPVSQFRFGNAVRLSYSRRNQFRVPDYFRWDVSVNIEGNHKIKKFAHSSWSLSFFNILGRQNVYSIYFVSGANGIQGYKLSIFGRPITTLTFNFKL